MKHQPGVLPQRVKLDFGPLLLHRTQRGAVVHQQRGGVDSVQRHTVGIGIDKFFEFVGVVARHPASQVEMTAHDARLDTVFMLQPVGHHLELQLADSP